MFRVVLALVAEITNELSASTTVPGWLVEVRIGVSRLAPPVT